MIRQHFHIEDKWEVIVYYDVDYTLFDKICLELLNIGTSEKTIYKLHKELSTNMAKGATVSNGIKHISIVLFNQHDTIEDYLNTVVHEAEHIKQAMLKAYNVKDNGEPPAYTIGYIVMKMYRIFRKFLAAEIAA